MNELVAYYKEMGVLDSAHILLHPGLGIHDWIAITKSSKGNE